MTPLVITIVIAYSLVIGLIVAKRQTLEHSKFIFVTATIAAILHTLYSYLNGVSNEGFDFSLFSMSNLISLGLVYMALMICATKPLLKLSLPFFGLALFNVLASYFSKQPPIHLPYNIAAHAIPSLLAYSILSFAAAQALVLWFQNNALKTNKLNKLIRALPPLDVLESTLFTIVFIGFALLSLSIVTGMIYIDDFFGQQLAHKSLFSALAWLTFAALLAGRHFGRWRGIPAIKWTLSGYFMLLIGYFGSKFVIEYLL